MMERDTLLRFVYCAKRGAGNNLTVQDPITRPRDMHKLSSITVDGDCT